MNIRIKDDFMTKPFAADRKKPRPLISTLSADNHFHWSHKQKVAKHEDHA